MRRMRPAIVILCFLALAGLEVARGVRRIENARQRSHEELLGTTIARGHARLAADLRDLIESPREHSRYLASLPALERCASDPSSRDSSRPAVERHFLRYLLAYGSLDRIRGLDSRGVELVRCERIGTEGAVAAIPPALLETETESAIIDLGRSLAPGQVGRTELLLDRERVEVPPGERQVFHHVVGIHPASPSDAGVPPRRAAGFLVLTVYAAPLLEAVRTFSPIDGTEAFLVDRAGNYLAHSSRTRERPGAGGLLADHPVAGPRLLDGAERTVEEDTTFLSLPAGDRSGWRLVVAVPDAALDAASGGLRRESLGTIVSVLLVTLLLAGAALLVGRLLRRAELLEEARRQQELERRLEIAERLGALGLITAGVAHEINNPLEGIGNYVALLARDDIPEERRREYLEHVRTGFDRIRDIVRDLSRASRESPSGHDADLARVVERALALGKYDARLRENDVELVGLGAPLLVSGDAGRLEQVFLNLLLNAGRATGDAGVVRVIAQRTETGGAPTIEISVEDDGPGIAPEHLERLFEPFFTTSDGSGLGLAISRGIVLAHDGTIRAENRPEGGARFIVGLPARPPGDG